MIYIAANTNRIYMIYGLPDKLVELVFNVCKMAKLLQIQCLLICKHYAINPKSALKERI